MRTPPGRRSLLAGGLILALLLLPLAARAASLQGRIEVWEKVGGKLTRLEDQSNAVVFVAGFPRKSKQTAIPELIQKNKSFSARVLVVTQGDVVEFPNQDPIFHNVWSKSRARRFDLGLYKFPNKKPVRFPRPGIVTVFCNIHAQMISTILVLPNEKAGITGPEGRYRIDGIPKGKYPVYAWVEGARPVKKVVSFRRGNTVNLNFRLLLKRIPLRHLNKEGKPYKKYPN